MLSIGEFSRLCNVSPKTLRYYAEIDLLLPDEINPANGYRYYSVKQLKRMLFINRLKSYNFSLDEIKAILGKEESADGILYKELLRKKREIEKQTRELEEILSRLEEDISNLQQGKSIMSYLDNIDVELAEVPEMNILSLRKMLHEYECAKGTQESFKQLLEKVKADRLTVLASPMTLFHSAEFGAAGLDFEFAIPVKEYVTGTRNFAPGLCLKTTVHGSYSQLSAVYARQLEYAREEGYRCSNALFEVYITDPSCITNERELITEVYYPVKKESVKVSEENSRLRLSGQVHDGEGDDIYE